MRRACIDIGTNTVKVLIADVQEGQVVALFSRDITTRLGEGLHETGKLLPAAILRTVMAVHEFHIEAKAYGADDVIVVTTSAARDAVNREEFFDQVRRVCAVDVTLVSGDREAELIFRGVCSDPQWSREPLLVIDVGGGSAEFVQGRDGKMELFQSLPLGALRLTEKFGEGRFTELCDSLRATLRPALARYDIRGRRLVGTGGTLTALAHVEVRRRISRLVISREKLRALVQRLEAMPLDERQKVPGLPTARADIIVAGGAVFLVAMELLGARELTVSVRNLRYGALLSL